MSSATLSDREAARAQLGRPVRGDPEVASRCHLHLPVVLRVPPVLDSGEPFPTLYWLCCPLAHKRIARLEAAGGVREADARASTDPGFAEELAEAHARYAAERDEALEALEGEVPIPPRGGVGGSSGGTKCLHAHYAHHAGGGENPLGAEVAGEIEPLDCERPCVTRIEGEAARNPEWSEPR